MNKLALTTMLALASCGPKNESESQVLRNGLRSDGYADVYTISGTHANGNVVLSIEAFNANSGAYTAYFGGQSYSGNMYYIGAGRFDIVENGQTEVWASFVAGSTVRLDANSLGFFFINI
jgi:hypothetical protein